ncbi:MAG TPA: SBBP repeat-containing protein [Casimicrobiaceae bacterium]
MAFNAVLAMLLVAAPFGALEAEPAARGPQGLPRAPLAFEANRGQADAQVQFVARGAGYTAFLTATEMVLRRGAAAVHLKPVGTAPAVRISGDDELPGVVNYFRHGPSTPISAPTYRAVRYSEIYPGIDLVYHGSSGRLEYDFIVAPGADPDRIGIDIDGAERLELDADGTLILHTASGDIRQPRPFAYQRIDGVARPVTADYVFAAGGGVRLRLGEYDRSRQLVIDPVVTYATYLGGSGDEAEESLLGEVHIARDGAGNIYMTGTTQSVDFPTTAGAYRNISGGADLFITKFSAAGAVLYSTYLGGPCEDYGNAIAVDAAGNAYVAGEVNGGGTCWYTPGVLVAKLDSAGRLVYATRMGGSLLDSSYGTAIAVDAAGHAYVTGVAKTSDFPTTSGAYRTVGCVKDNRFAGDGFVAKLTVDGSALVYSTLLCGKGDDAPAGIAIDAAGNAYVAGATGSSNFPLVHPIQTTRGGGVVGFSGFVSKLNASGSQLLYSTYLGGSGSTVINAIALDGQLNAYVTGETDSVDFPTTPGVIQPLPGKRHCIEGCTDAFVSKIAPSGAALVYSTYLYGEGDDAGNAIAVDVAGNAYVVGQTVSHLFPIVDAFQSSNRGLDDAFVVKLNANATRLLYSSYFGGSKTGKSPSTGSDTGTGIVVDDAGNAYIAGYTLSFDLRTTSNAFQRSIGGGVCDYFGAPCGDAFLAKIGAGGPGVTPAIHLTVSPTDASPGATITATWAGNPTPTSRDYLRLFALGSAGDEFDDPVIWWPTPNASAGARSVPLPASLPAGWYEMRLLSPDASGVIGVIARSAPIHVGPHADVVVTAVTNPPAAASPGRSFTVTDTTANHGMQSSMGSVTRFYLSLDRARNTGDRLLTGSRSVGALAPNAASTGTTTVTLPTATPVGKYVLLACADDTATNGESNEGNNCIASAASVSIVAPDLVSTAVSNPPVTARLGGAFKVSDSTANRGNAASAASVTRYYLSLDRVKSTGDRLLGGSRNVPVLAPNAVSAGAATVTVPTTTPLGSYFLLACADDTKVGIESNETNNCVASASAVKVGP